MAPEKDALADPVDLRENNAEKPAGKQRLTRRSTSRNFCNFDASLAVCLQIGGIGSQLARASSADVAAS